MFRNISISVWLLVGASPSFADQFNQKNIVDLCAEDASFESRCFTYIAAYKDLLGYLVWSTDEERARLLCLLNVSTDRIVRRLPVATETDRPGQVADLLVREFCN